MGAAATVVGQNIGAGQPERADAGRQASPRASPRSAPRRSGCCFLFFPAQLLAVFGMRDAEAVEIGVQLLRVLSVSGVFIATALAYTGGLQGAGDTKSPLFISIVSQVVVPLGHLLVDSRVTTLEPLHVWGAILAGHATRCTLSILRFRQGKWRGILGVSQSDRVLIFS